LSDKIEPKPDGANANSEPKMLAAAPAVDPAIERPAFDVVRVDPTGETVVAGHATPKAAVELRDGGRVIAEVDADESGQFVVLPPPLATGSHRLELAAPNGGARAVVSDPVTIDVAVRKPEISGPLAIPPRAPATATAADESELQKPAPAHADSPAPQPRTVASADRVAPLPVPPVASALAAEKPGPVREAALTPTAVVQAPPKPPAEPVAQILPPAVLGLPAGEAGPRVSVRTVEAPGPGRLEVRGVAEPNSTLRLYLNGSPLADAAAGTDRRWSLTIEHGMSPGFYTFRADEIDRSNGAVSARAEVPFSYPPRLPQPPSPARTGAAPASAAKVAATIFEAPSKPPPVPSPSAEFAVATSEVARSAVVGPASAPTLMQTTSAPTSAPAPHPGAPAAAMWALATSPIPAVSAVKSANLPEDVVIADVQTTTVVAGDNLWDLARRFYGDGMRFRQIYAANASQIREPRLIYIGQKFVVPKEVPP
jgi:LysM repeat protein